VQVQEPPWWGDPRQGGAQSVSSHCWPPRSL